MALSLESLLLLSVRPPCPGQSLRKVGLPGPGLAPVSHHIGSCGSVAMERCQCAPCWVLCSLTYNLTKCKSVLAAPSGAWWGFLVPPHLPVVPPKATPNDLYFKCCKHSLPAPPCLPLRVSIFPSLQMRELRHREVKDLIQGGRTSK